MVCDSYPRNALNISQMTPKGVSRDLVSNSTALLSINVILYLFLFGYQGLLKINTILTLVEPNVRIFLAQ